MSCHSSILPLSTTQPSTHKEPIAIIGIGCRFPGNVQNPEEFWNALKSGYDAISDVPEDRWKLENYYDPDTGKAGKIKSRKGGFLKDIDKFDASFFNIFPKEAERIDPQQRMLLEISYEALEDAGIRIEDFSGSDTCVYMGVFTTDYWDIQSSSLQKDKISPHVAMGASSTSVANRLSYVYNLKGPSVSLNTACSSSLVALHLACQSIWNGESQMGLAGGVNLILKPETSILMSKGNFLSPDGYCKTFDSRANGYVRSEGGGVVLLKPLSKALADGDQIYSLIRATAVNSDGYTEDGFTVPNPDAQTALLETVYRQAGVDPAKVVYVEAHGTGTPVGDPLETKAFGNVIGKRTEQDPLCVIGSVKTNIGHLEAAAGIAGLIKLALITKYRQIPKNLHFEKPNPKIPFAEYKLRVATALESISPDITVVYGGVNSFGAGGTNAHCVLQEYIPQQKQTASVSADQETAHLLLLSAKSETSLKELAGRYIEFLKSTDYTFRNICFSLATRRSVFEHKLSVVARSKEEACGHLEAFLKGEARQGMAYEAIKQKAQPKVAFVYSGQGPQWFAMGQQLLRQSPLFREVITKIDKLFSNIAGYSLLEEMSRDEKGSKISDTRIAQPAIMAIQIALTEVWKSFGVNPAGLIGHSIGEVAAAYAAGALTLEQAVEVIYHRSRNQNQATGKGKMLAVGLDLPAVRKEIKGMEAKVDIAAINGSAMITLAGDAPQLAQIAASLEKRDIFHRFLQVNVPFHSYHMEPLKEEMLSSLLHVKPRQATTPLYSTVTGKKENGLHLTSEYWYRNVRETVYFTDAIASMLADRFDTFIEIGPHPVLSSGITDMLKMHQAAGVVMPSLRRKEDEEVTMMHSLGILSANGYAVDWNRLFPGAGYVKLPHYPWQHERYWYETKEHKKARMGGRVHPFLTDEVVSLTSNSRRIWKVNLNPETFTYLQDHKVDGAIVFPGTGHLEIALAAGINSFPGKAVFLEDIHFEKALFLPEEGEQPEIRLEIINEEGEYYFCSKPAEAEKAEGEAPVWTKHSRGKINYVDNPVKNEPVAVGPLLAKLQSKISIPDFYVGLKEAGLNYGETFRRVQKLWVNNEEILAAVSLSTQTAYGVNQYVVHPALLDACLHTIFAARENTDSAKRGIYLPVHIEQYKVFARPTEHVWTYVQVREASADYLKGNYQILDEEGNMVAAIEGLTCKYIQGSRGEQAENLYNGMYEYKWELPEGKEQANTDTSALAEDECYLIFSDETGMSKRLLAQFTAGGITPLQVVKGDTFREFDKTLFQVNPAKGEDINTLFEAISKGGMKIKKILYLWALDNQPDEVDKLSAFEPMQKALITGTMNLLQTIDKRGIKAGMVFITEGAEVVNGADKEVNYAQAPLLGMFRVFLNEYPYVPVKLIDISAHPADGEVSMLYNEFTASKFRFTELALRGTETFVRKLRPITEETATGRAAKKVAAQGSAFRAIVKRPGDLESLAFYEIPVQSPEADEVLIRVCAWGINKRDWQTAMGKTGNKATSLGSECAGTVLAVGYAVKHVKEGDHVIAWAENCFAGQVMAKAQGVLLKPANVSFAEAAGIPSAYTVAWYALRNLAQINKGHTVLIHTAHWDVSMAAIGIARYIGCHIIATASTEEKKAYLQSLGIAHVVDEGHAAFSEEIMLLTAGKGVDAVLNSLRGIGMIRSLKCLAPFGKFIELNPENITDQASLELKRLSNNISFHTVDIEGLSIYKPETVREIMGQVLPLFEQGKLKASPVKTFPVADLSNALVAVGEQERVAKLVIVIDENPLQVLPAQTLSLSPEATYLITGGASGFGLEIARWLTQKGAKHLVLVSRSGPKSDADREVIKEMESNGVQVKLIGADITDQKAVTELVKSLNRTMPPLKGIVHSAAMIDDQSIPDMTPQIFMKVYRPKVYGAWNFHLATKDMPLDFFLMLSSISAIFGFPGQANYSSANNFLDKLAMHRQSLGLKGCAANLGVLDDYAGMSKEGGRLIRALINQGWILLSLKEVTDKLENVLLQQPAMRMLANLDWKRFRDFYYNLKDDPRFSHLMSESVSKGGGANGTFSLLDTLQEVSEEEKMQLLIQKATQSLANILGVAQEKIDVSMPITKIGLDSLMLNQLRNWIQQKLEINFPLMKIAKGPSIKELSSQLLLELHTGNSVEQQTTSADSSGIAHEEDIEVYNQWLVRNKLIAGKGVNYRIFCIHPVGAGASMFSHFIFNPPKDAEVLAFQLPGRENRSNEAHYEDIGKLVADMAGAMKGLLDKPFIIFGHSFGGMVGFELIRYIGQHFDKKPVQLFISGTIAPQLTKKWKQRDVISETAILTNSEERLLSLMSYIDDVEFLKKILPVMRKDMALIMNYVYAPGTRFDFPITAFAADQDTVVYAHEVEQWKEQTGHQFTLEVLEGDHWFLSRNKELISKRLSEALSAVMA